MTYEELNESLACLSRLGNSLEEMYIENEGECTEQTEQMEQDIEDLKELVCDAGADMLGRWMKEKEELKGILEAERDHLNRQMKAIDNTIDFIKGKVADVMKLTGQEKIKGTLGYSFTASKSVKTDLNKDFLKSRYTEIIENAIRSAGVPEYIGFTLTASSTTAGIVGIKEEDADLFHTIESDAVRFTKPRKKKA